MDYALAKRKHAARSTSDSTSEQPAHNGALVPDSHFCKLSTEYRCLSANALGYIQAVVKGKPPKLKPTGAARLASLERLLNVGVFRAGVVHAGDTRVRYMVKIVFPKEETTRFCDIVTGTLYQEDGQCLTSSNLTMSVQPVPCSRNMAKKFLDELRSMDVAEC